MKIKNYEFTDAEWKKDICGGRYDFDFGVINVSCRYWPNNTVDVCVMIGDLEKTLYEDELEGNSLDDCKNKAELWVKEKVEIIINKIEE